MNIIPNFSIVFDILQIRFREDVACFLVCNSPISDIAKHAEPGNHFFLKRVGGGWRFSHSTVFTGQ